MTQISYKHNHHIFMTTMYLCFKINALIIKKEMGNIDRWVCIVKTFNEFSWKMSFTYDPHCLTLSIATGDSSNIKYDIVYFTS